MNCHSGDYDLDVLVSERGDGAAEGEVLICGFVVEEGDLDDGDV